MEAFLFLRLADGGSESAHLPFTVVVVAVDDGNGTHTITDSIIHCHAQFMMGIPKFINYKQISQILIS